MKPTQDNYPIRNYLDEQERLTRANLIGIGIVCGLEISYEPAQTPATIHLSRGCGVTSEGYLIVEPHNVSLVSYREYTLPSDIDYPPFKDNVAVQYPLWELFPAGEPDTTPLGTPDNFLNDKAVLLFLELKKEGLRNCSPNNCDDKGAAVTAVVRRLLITRTDLDKVIEAANKLDPGLSSAELAQALTAKLGLVDLRLPRYDVPNTGPVTSEQVLAAFCTVFKSGKFSEKTAAVLSATYQAFKPLVLDLYPDDPFLNAFSGKFGFLDSAPKTPVQVLFLQYYYDLFDELRCKGVNLICACCPPDGLFPRHLMLGLLVPDAQSSTSIYRQQLLASPALNRCADNTNEVKQLFQRLVQMTLAFTDTPSLPESVESRTDRQIRITPSRLGCAPLRRRSPITTFRKVFLPVALPCTVSGTPRRRVGTAPISIWATFPTAMPRLRRHSSPIPCSTTWSLTISCVSRGTWAKTTRASCAIFCH